MSRGVLVTTPSRLHFSLIDLNSDLGRVDGSVGVALSYPRARITVRPAKKWAVPAAVKWAVEGIQQRTELAGKYAIEVKESIPEHVGFGSHTQMGLAVAKGIMQLEGKRLDVPELARLVKRGGTSGIGVAAFEWGGFILDGGHRYDEKGGFLPSSASKAGPPPVLFQSHLPRDWVFVVAVPAGRRIHGRTEVDFFKKHTPIPRKEVGQVARIVLMVLLPAVIERDIEAFGRGLTLLQDQGFKAREIGAQPDEVVRLHRFFRKAGAAGFGQSSFGPATYGLVKGWKVAEQLGHKVMHEMDEKGEAFLCPVAGNGATVQALRGDSAK